MMKPNMKVLAGIGVVAAATLLFLPSAFGWLLPLLFLAACPLAMIFMMRGMGTMSARGEDASRSGAADATERPAPASDAEETRLRAELDQLQAERSALETNADSPSSQSGPRG